MKVCITTIVSGKYQWYIPLFLDRIRKEYPECVPLVFIRGACELPHESQGGCITGEYGIGTYREYPEDASTTVCLRFVMNGFALRQFDYTLITDVDILMKREDPPFWEQRLSSMHKHGLECYDNYTVSTNRTYGNMRVPGVHFVTEDWWDRTAAARESEAGYLKANKVDYNYDEYMLGNLIIESKLPLPKNIPALWNMHGLHLGSWRRGEWKHRIPPAHVTNQIVELLRDKEFMQKVEISSRNLPDLKDTFGLFMREWGRHAR